MISIQFISYHFKREAKQVYWLYRLSQAQLGKGTQLEFPLIVEGKGKIQFGNEARIQRKVILANVGTSSVLENKSHLFTYCAILPERKTKQVNLALALLMAHSITP